MEKEREGGGGGGGGGGERKREENILSLATYKICIQVLLLDPALGRVTVSALIMLRTMSVGHT